MLVTNIRGLTPAFTEGFNHEKVMATAKFFVSDLPGSFAEFEDKHIKVHSSSAFPQSNPIFILCVVIITSSINLCHV
uniref:Uncharacterized protein n=1 Tax=Timema douglasi TaxID=61478 RepID=A0A7R8Z9G1_TIMDO|nr:unnamed protein product [Timema douglasi]